MPGWKTDEIKLVVSSFLNYKFNGVQSSPPDFGVSSVERWRAT
jgi:hypothetical protein